MKLRAHEPIRAKIDAKDSGRHNLGTAHSVGKPWKNLSTVSHKNFVVVIGGFKDHKRVPFSSIQINLFHEC